MVGFKWSVDDLNVLFLFLSSRRGREYFAIIQLLLTFFPVAIACAWSWWFFFWSECFTFSAETRHCVSEHISSVEVTAKKGASFCNSHLGFLNEVGRVQKSEEPRVSMLIGIWWDVRWVFTTSNNLCCFTATETEVPELLAHQLLNCFCHQQHPIIVLR